MSNLLKDNIELVKQWCYSKNKNLDLNKLTIGSSKKAWWRCEKGHEWQTSIKTRCKGSGCPYCSNQKLLVGYNDLATTNPELIKKWNYKRNRSLEPTNIKAGSHSKVWWICEKGHEWQAEIRDVVKGRGCPICSNKKILVGYNDLATTNPELVKEWDCKKNGSLNPKNVLVGSHKKIWWRCEKGHEWQTTAKERCKGSGCPYCSNHFLQIGYNDLATTNPELAKEWNYEKNGSLKPSNVKEGSHDKVWWRCENGHEWQSAINQRANGSNCPYCSSRKLLVGYNDLATTNPELAKEWNYEKNGSLKPTNVMPGSSKKAWWKCEKGHEWESSIQVRSSGHGCPICIDELQTSLPERIVYYYIKKYFPSAIHNYVPQNFNRRELDIYLPNHSVGIEYDGSYFHNDYKKDLEKDKLCKKNNIKLYRIREHKLSKLNYDSTSIIILLNDETYDSLKKAILYILNDLRAGIYDVDIEKDLDKIYEFINFTEKSESLLECYPHLAKEWNYEKNGNLEPKYVKMHSGKKVWWKCERGHEWQAEINNRTKGCKW